MGEFGWRTDCQIRLPIQIDSEDSRENQPEKQPIRTDFLVKDCQFGSLTVTEDQENGFL